MGGRDSRAPHGYGSAVPEATGGLIASVAPDSAAARAGLVAGDRVCTAEGAPLADVIDWQWYTDEAVVEIDVESATGESRHVLLEREAGESWGIQFSGTVFDRVRTCRNSCAFCFMAQLPKGLRPALYLRDDDFRLSFLQGNFITLTSLTDQIGRAHV